MPFVLSAPKDRASVVSPLTTLVEARVRATGTDSAAVEAALKSRYPQVEAQTNAEYIKDTEAQVDQLLALIYALLLLSVIVSLFGIVNTLVLSISERTREIAMLRAIGTSRGASRRRSGPSTSGRGSAMRRPWAAAWRSGWCTAAGAAWTCRPCPGSACCRTARCAN